MTENYQYIVDEVFDYFGKKFTKEYSHKLYDLSSESDNSNYTNKSRFRK